MDNKTAAERIYGPEQDGRKAGNTLLGSGRPAPHAKPTKASGSKPVAEVLYGGTNQAAALRK